MKRGVYYTPIDFFSNGLEYFELPKLNETTSILDLCCGNCNLFIGFLNKIRDKYSKNIIKSIIKNSLFIDINDIDFSTIRIWYNNNIEENNININYIKCDIFANPDIITSKFDIILSNPPFINLKSETKYKDELRRLGYYSIFNDTYLLAIEIILRNFIEQCILIMPSQLFSNYTNNKIIKKLLNNYSVNNILEFNERNNIFNINQKISLFDVKHNYQSNMITFMRCQYLNNKINIIEKNIINKDIYKGIDKIVYLNDDDIELIEHFKDYKRLKDYPNIIYRCGDIDLSIDKKHITNTKTDYPLVRGRNLKSLDISEYINKETVQSKKIDIKYNKLVCQQISNMNSKRRLYFREVLSNYIISNSCNYIYTKDSSLDINDIKRMLNNDKIDRYFRILSGNNHITIKEISNLPISL